MIPEDVAAGIAAEIEIPGANISSISVQRLIVAAQGLTVAADAAKYYTSIGRVITTVNMHCGNILSIFKIEWEVYIALKIKDTPKAPAI